MHVQNYDELPIGELAPIPRTSLQLSQSEQNYLSMSISMNQRVAESLNEITTGYSEIEDTIKSLVTKLENHFKVIDQKLINATTIWAKNLPALVKQLRETAQKSEISDEERQNLNSLANQLHEFYLDYNAYILPLMEYMDIHENIEQHPRQINLAQYDASSGRQD